MSPELTNHGSVTNGASNGDQGRLFASIRRYRVLRGSMDVLARRVDEELAEEICAQPGFVSYEFMNCGHNRVMTLSMFEHAEQADASRELARQWTERSLAEFEFDTLGAMRAEVLVNRAAPEILEAARPAAAHRFSSIRRYRMGGGSVAELMRRIDQILADRIAAIDAVEAYHALNCDSGDLLSMTVGRNRTFELEWDEMARWFIGEHLSGFAIERTETIGGEVIVSRAKAKLLEPAHA